MEYYSAIKNNEIMSIATKWMDFEMIILSEVSHTDRERQMSWYHFIFTCGIKKYDTNELIYKSEMDSHTSKTSLWRPKQKCGRGEGKLGVWD